MHVIKSVTMHSNLMKTQYRVVLFFGSYAGSVVCAHKTDLYMPMTSKYTPNVSCLGSQYKNRHTRSAISYSCRFDIVKAIGNIASIMQSFQGILVTGEAPVTFQS